MQSIGDQPYYLQPIQIQTDAVNGNVLTYTWDGRADYLLADYSILVTGAQRGEYRSQNGSRAEVIATFGNVPADPNVSEVPVTTFSLRTEEISQNLFSHPAYSGISSDIAALVQHLANNRDEPNPQGQIYTLCARTDPSGNTGLLAYKIYEFILRGEEHYLVSQSYTLAMNRTMSGTYARTVLAAIFDNDGKLFSSGGLANYTQTILPWVVPQLGLVASTEPLQLVFAWRKRGTDIQTLPNGNVQMSEQWQSGRMSRLIYATSSWA